MKLILALPLIIPLATAALCLLNWRRRSVQRWLGVAGSFALLGAGVALLWEVSRHGITAVQAGGWPAPFGITLVADLFSALMVLITGVMASAVAVYSTANVDKRRESFGYYPLFHVLLLGVCGSFLTGDIFNLYVWFEVMLIASFVLIALGGERGPDRRRAEVRHLEPDGLGRVSGGRGVAVQRRRDAEHGRPGSQAAGAAGAGTGGRAGDAVPGRLRNQSRRLPVFFSGCRPRITRPLSRFRPSSRAC